MYITDLSIQNVKLLRDFDLHFGTPDKPRMWTVLIGANGTCKTAVLQCIAMAATGQARSNHLVEVAALPDRRLTDPVARIEGVFSFGCLGHSRRPYPGLPEEARNKVPGLRSSIVVAPGEKELRGPAHYLTGRSSSSPRSPTPGAGPGMSAQQFHESGLLEEMATVFDSKASAFGLLETIGYPRSRTPGYGQLTAIQFWRLIVRELDKGLLADGLNQLVTAAAEFYPGNRMFSRATTSDSAESSFNPLEVVRAKDLADWFCAAYGTSRLLPKPLDRKPQRSSSEERIATLFGRGQMIGTEFARILDHLADYNQAMNAALIASGLLPAATRIELHDRGWARSADDIVEGDLVTLRHGSESVEVPATWLSQGYQSTVSWIADLVGWFFFEHGKPIPLDEMEGLVLIDEIDLHLHPAWQEDLIPVLKRIFPRLQFVVTTHSPMVLTGLKPEEIFILDQDDAGNVIPRQIDDMPAFLTGSQIQDRYFGVRRVQPARLGSALRRYGVLSKADPKILDEEDRRELEDLQIKLVAAGINPESGRSL